MNYRRVLLVALSVLLFIAFIIGFYWLSTRGRITIILPEGQKTILITQNELSESFETEATSFTKTLRSGSVTIDIRTASESYVSINTVGRFLSSKIVEARIEPENPREFIGTNPRSCSDTIGLILVSYACRGELFGLVFHRPASATTPSTVLSVETIFENKTEEVDELNPGVIEGTFKEDGKLFILVKTNRNSGNTHALYEAVVKDNNYDVVFRARLDNLDRNQLYSVNKSDGILEFSSGDFKHVFSGESYNSLEKTILIDTGLPSKVELLRRKKGFVVNTEEVPLSNGDGFEISSIKTKVTLANSSGEDSKSIELDQRVGVLDFCGQLICVVDESQILRIYDTNLDEKYSIINVLNIMPLDKKNIMLQTTDGVVRFNIEELKGYYVYRQGFDVVSMSITGNKTILSVRGKASSHALVLANTQSNSNDMYVDQALQNIVSSVFVFGFSAYGEYVYVSSELGEREYNPESETFRHPQSVKDAAAVEINRLVKDSGLTEQGYKVTITGL